MKNCSPVLFIILFLGCNNEVATSNDLAQEAAAPAADNCSNNIWFRKGAKVNTSSYDGQGNEIARSVTTVAKVFTNGKMTISELEMKSTDKNGANEKLSNASYKCDGKIFYMDMSGLMPGGKQTTEIETSGLELPFAVSVGDTLPDNDYTIVMRSEGNVRKIKSHIKERKVESKETVRTPGGSFDCYKISSVIETDIDMPGMDEKSKKVMEEMRKKMGKNKMIMWYAPEITIVKMEFHMGEKLISRTEVTAIKK
jgi:hypothetical protein